MLINQLFIFSPQDLERKLKKKTPKANEVLANCDLFFSSANPVSANCASFEPLRSGLPYFK